MDLADELRKLAELREAGHLTDQEFADAKRRLIGDAGAKPPPLPKEEQTVPGRVAPPPILKEKQTVPSRVAPPTSGQWRAIGFGLLLLFVIFLVTRGNRSGSQSSSSASRSNAPAVASASDPEIKKWVDDAAKRGEEWNMGKDSATTSPTPTASPTNATLTPAPTPESENAAVVDARKAGLPIAKKAFERGLLSVQLAMGTITGSDWEALEKKYGEQGSEDYVETYSNAAEEEFNRLVVNEIGKKPEKEGDYDKDEANRVYWNVFAHVEKVIKSMANDEGSIKFERQPGQYQLTRHKDKYAWGLTFHFTGKNAFNATVKNSVNVYIAKNAIIDFEENARSITEKNLAIALSQQAAPEKKGATKKKTKKN